MRKVVVFTNLILDGVMQAPGRPDEDRRGGFHTCLAVVGDVGREPQGEYSAFGDAVNLAARLEQTAQPGTMQISAQTYQLVKQTFNCEPLGEIRLKGKQSLVQTYRVLGLKAELAPLRRQARQGLHSPLLGREGVFAMVKECMQRLEYLVIRKTFPNWETALVAALYLRAAGVLLRNQSTPQIIEALLQAEVRPIFTLE